MSKKRRINTIKEDIVKHPKFYYVLGALEGDGYFNLKRGCFSINATDYDFLVEIKRIIKKLSPQTKLHLKKYLEAKGKLKAQWRINLYSKDFFDKRLHLLEPKTIEQKIHYLRGLFDAEGSIQLFNRQVKRKGKVYWGKDKSLTLHQSDRGKLDLWSGWLEELGIKSMKIYRDDGRSCLNLRRNESIKLFNDLIGFKIKRKQKILDNVIAYINKWNITYKNNIQKIPIKSIKKVGVKKTYDIQNDAYKNFILKNRIITHNSVFAMTISAFLSYCLKQQELNPEAFKLENIFFDHKDLIKQAQSRPKYSVILYDEAREGLATQKATTTFQQDLIQFFNECGQLNHIYILVLADFFDMRETMAVGRSEFLVNVYKRDIQRKVDLYGLGEHDVVFYERGHFQFFNKRAKDLLYDFFRTTRRKNYSMIKPSFPVGNFTNQYPVDEKAYKKLKKQALERFRLSEEKETKHGSMVEKSRTERAEFIAKNRMQLAEMRLKEKEVAEKSRLELEKMKQEFKLKMEKSKRRNKQYRKKKAEKNADNKKST